MPIRHPKDTFLASTSKVPFEAVASSDAFHIACDYALLVLSEETPLRPTPNEAADAHQQMVGARRVLNILKTLSEPREKPREPIGPKLNYKV